MPDASPPEIEAAALRIEQVLQETLDRYVGGDGAARGEAIFQALRAELRALPADARGGVLAALQALHPVDVVVPATPAGPSVREGELEAEVERLRAQVATHTAAPAPSGRLAERVARALLGSARDVGRFLAQGGAAEDRLVEAIEALVGFAGQLGRVYGGATADSDRTMAGRFEGLLADAVEGRRSAPVLRDLFDGMYQQIGRQILAFREACETGTRNFLKQISPGAIEADSAKGATQVGGRRPFFYRECWEYFEKRYEELRMADHLYESYFDGAFRSALLRQSQEQERTG